MTVDDAIVVRDYTEDDPVSNGDLKTIRYGCVREPTKRGQLNHFEVKVSENRIEVYGTNAANVDLIMRGAGGIVQP